MGTGIDVGTGVGAAVGAGVAVDGAATTSVAGGAVVWSSSGAEPAEQPEMITSARHATATRARHAALRVRTGVDGCCMAMSRRLVVGIDSSR